MTLTLGRPYDGPVLNLPAAQYRAHGADGSKAPAHTESHARRLAADLARALAAPVAVERWDLTRQQWVLVDLAGTPS